ncbi:MAG: hypothetical protein IJR00_09190 [Lachnospiraceae bacterium]|nr:hypothetical protein [Lachnospiraceae bacterium]
MRLANSSMKMPPLIVSRMQIAAPQATTGAIMKTAYFPRMPRPNFSICCISRSMSRQYIINNASAMV